MTAPFAFDELMMGSLQPWGHDQAAPTVPPMPKPPTPTFQTPGMAVPSAFMPDPRTGLMPTLFGGGFVL